MKKSQKLPEQIIQFTNIPVNKHLIFFFLFFAVTLSVPEALRADRIVVHEGKGRNLSGKVTASDATKLVVLVQGKSVEVPANSIALTVYNDEPAPLNVARNAIAESRYPEALDALAKINPANLPTEPPFLWHDYAFFLATAKVHVAMAGTGDVQAAAEPLAQFMAECSQSYHYYDACRLYGDLMLHRDQPDEAAKAYEILAQAPWSDYSLPATVAFGMVQVNVGNTEAARSRFESVLESKDDGTEQTSRQQELARIGLALCSVSENRADEAIAALEDIAARPGTEDAQFQATLFNSLGWAFERADRPKEAILAYLHTDILFSSVRKEHITALKRLSILWERVHRADRKDEVDKRLKTLYSPIVP